MRDCVLSYNQNHIITHYCYIATFATVPLIRSTEEPKYTNKHIINAINNAYKDYYNFYYNFITKQKPE